MKHTRRARERPTAITRGVDPIVYEVLDAWPFKSFYSFFFTLDAAFRVAADGGFLGRFCIMGSPVDVEFWILRRHIYTYGGALVLH